MITVILTCLCLWAIGGWLLSLHKQDSSVADQLWGPGFILLSLAVLGFSGQPGWRSVLLAALVCLWGLRLALHIHLRHRMKGEDRRYRRWREAAGESWWRRSLFTVFGLQAALMGLISLPLLLIMRDSGTDAVAVFDGIGLLVFLIGFWIEARADAQLLAHQRNPMTKTQLLKDGWWARSRHPNYFGETLVWWGFSLISAGQHGLVSLTGAVLITLLLLFFSGVPLLDRSLESSKPGFAEYKRQTPAFFPRIGRGPVS
jgi:steroid 5-alpha reductase family enzyme